MYLDEHRGSGVTTRQILDLPYGAIFVVGQIEQKNYCKMLCRHLQRHDVRVMVVEDVWQDPPTKILGFDVDHAAYDLARTKEQRERLIKTRRFLETRRVT